ncbi:hypothetical protein HN587_05335 [Candidatus Woesearchaeota archaeon]|mgnify:CR=1 FL=1|jgi:hypothetical protein|nr:hypothetical protein [Candidatus Woesearchaeota archaeon]
MVAKLINELSREYGVSERKFYVSDSELDREIYIKNLHGLLMNPFVKDRLLRSKQEIFKEASAFDEMIQSVTYLVATMYSSEEDFASIGDFNSMWAQTQSYVRDESTITRDSTRIREGLVEILSDVSDDLDEQDVIPLLYGSVKYGDANRYSDLDILFLIPSETSRPDVRALIDDVDQIISHEFEGKNMIRDDMDPATSAISLGHLHSKIVKMKNGETSKLADYTIKGNEMYPLNWILEGDVLVKLDDAQEDLDFVKAELLEAVKTDPFLEFVMSYHLYRTIQKREENKDRK